MGSVAHIEARFGVDPPLDLGRSRFRRLDFCQRSLDESHQLLHRSEVIRAATVDVLDSARELGRQRIGLLAKLDHEGAPHGWSKWKNVQRLRENSVNF